MNIPKVADGAACVSWAACAVSHIEDMNQVLQLMALCVAIVSGACAAYYHVRLIRRMK
jgi:hypothetical protein